MWDNKYMNYEQWHDGKDGTKKKGNEILFS